MVFILDSRHLEAGVNIMNMPSLLGLKTQNNLSTEKKLWSQFMKFSEAYHCIVALRALVWKKWYLN